MMRKGIFAEKMILKIEDLILMIKKEGIMITDKFIIRKADNISYQNEIAKFYPMYFHPTENISAISIENIKVKILSEDRYKLLYYVCQKIDNQVTKIKVMICLYQQTNTKFIKYKGEWGMLKSQCIDIDKIEDKKEIVLERNGMLDFILEGIINIKDDFIVKGILEITNVIYFFLGKEQGV